MKKSIINTNIAVSGKRMVKFKEIGSENFEDYVNSFLNTIYPQIKPILIAVRVKNGKLEIFDSDLVFTREKSL